MSPSGRCALTAPFHPYPDSISRIGAVCFLLHFPSGRPALPLAGTPIHEVLGLSSPGPNCSGTAATVRPPRDTVKGTRNRACDGVGVLVKTFVAAFPLNLTFSLGEKECMTASQGHARPTPDTLPTHHKTFGYSGEYPGRSMESRQLGKNGLTVPVVCLGAWPLGGGMGEIPDEQAIATIHASIGAGVNFIDTAEGYRTSEAVLGKAIKGRRNDVILATKLSGDHSPEHMSSAIENSLHALGTDYIDLYQLHGPRPEYPIEETMASLLKLRDDGKIRYIGISNFSSEQHAEAARFGPVHSSQPRYNMFHRTAEESVLPTCLELGIGVIPHSPLAKGMLTGKYRPGHIFAGDDERAGKLEFKDDQFNVAYPIVERLIEWASGHGRDGAQLAIAWTLAHPAVTSCIAGAKTPEQAIHNASAGDWRLTSGDMAEISEILGDFQLKSA